MVRSRFRVTRLRYSYGPPLSAARELLAFVRAGFGQVEGCEGLSDSAVA